jgi:hypothetical protein
MIPLKKSELGKLSWLDKALIVVHLLWVLTRLPALPPPVHFALVASLTMFALLPLMPLESIALPITIGGGISFALLVHQRRK